ncbi:hypothetical protein [Bacillus haynesii]|nr:hypothetical protein [Bacillus haynesii]
MNWKTWDTDICYGSKMGALQAATDAVEHILRKYKGKENWNL